MFQQQFRATVILNNLMVLGVCVTATSSHSTHSISIVIVGPFCTEYSVSWNVTFHVISNDESPYTKLFSSPPPPTQKENVTVTGKIEGPNIRRTWNIYYAFGNNAIKWNWNEWPTANISSTVKRTTMFRLSTSKPTTETMSTEWCKTEPTVWNFITFQSLLKYLKLHGFHLMDILFGM